MAVGDAVETIPNVFVSVSLKSRQEKYYILISSFTLYRLTLKNRTVSCRGGFGPKKLPGKCYCIGPTFLFHYLFTMFSFPPHAFLATKTAQNFQMYLPTGKFFGNLYGQSAIDLLGNPVTVLHVEGVAEGLENMKTVKCLDIEQPLIIFLFGR